MKKILALIVVLLVLHIPVAMSKDSGPAFMEVFSGYLGLGESLTFGNYTLTVVNFLYNAETGTVPLVLFRLRDNRNFTSGEFALGEGQSYTYKDVKVYLDYVKNPTSNPSALIAVYSKPTTVFYGTARANSTFSYGPVQLSIVNVSNSTVFMRYYRDGFVDYAYFGVGGHYWHSVDIVIYNITNGSVRVKILAPKYIMYSIVQGAVVVIQRVNFTPVEVGGVFNLTITIKNIGDQTARFVSVYLYSVPIVQGSERIQKTLLPTVTIPTFQQEIPFAAYMVGPIQYTDELAPGQNRTLHFQLIASKAIKSDVYPLYIRIKYGNQNGVVKEEEIQIGIPVNDVIRPRVSIESFKIIPNPVRPSSNFSVILTVKNTGNDEAYDVRVEVLTTKPQESVQTYSLFPTAQAQPQESYIYPAGKQSVLYFSRLHVNDTATGKLYFAVKDVSNGIYPLYVIITYIDRNGVEYKSQGTFGVPVRGYPKLKVYIGNVWISNGKYNFEIDIANDGKAPARGVTVSISSSVLSLFPLGERYVGSIEPMDYDSVNFVVLNSTLKAGRYPVNVRISYMLPGGNFTCFNETLEVQIPVGISHSGNVKFYYGIGIIIIITVIFLWRRGRG